jgi:tRNA-splicing endonuclease subunit Sen2
MCAFLLNRFALVVVPVYEDEEDQKASPFNLPNSSPFSWSWLSTINRVNSQVQKVRDLAPELHLLIPRLLQTLILVYITIPARSRLSLNVLQSPACLTHYTVKEVIVRRFIPARMRD